jgi:UDP-2,3-diacylglucosamine pyrophosphatase LpxH
VPTSVLERTSLSEPVQVPGAFPVQVREALGALALAGRLDSLIVSDLHLGLRGSRSAELLKLMQTLRFERLILLGDILHDATLRRLSGDDWALISALRELRHRADAPEVLPVLGNHDRGCGDLLARLLDRPVADSVHWTHAGRRFLAIHGDLFDRFVTSNRRTAKVVSAMFGFCQRRLSWDGRWPHAADQFHVRLTGLGRKMAEAALAHAGHHGADVIFCGHSHQPYTRSVVHDGPCRRQLTYLNTGAWLGIRPSFVTVSLDGSARLHHFA